MLNRLFELVEKAIAERRLTDALDALPLLFSECSSRIGMLLEHAKDFDCADDERVRIAERLAAAGGHMLSLALVVAPPDTTLAPTTPQTLPRDTAAQIAQALVCKGLTLAQGAGVAAHEVRAWVDSVTADDVQQDSTLN